VVVNRIKAALFDFGGVLVPSPLGVFADYERLRGLPAGAISRAVVSRGEAGAWARLERGEDELTAFAERFAAELAEDGHDVDVAALLDAIGELQLRPEMLEAVRRARETVKTGLLTNNWREEGQPGRRMRPTMDGLIETLRELFDAVVESCLEGLRKPDPRIYAIACERLGVEADEVVFLDDLGVNLKAARALGMTTIKVTEPAAAIAELGEVLGW
jgi:putative hydrolase of the HAD superfamily